MVILERNLKSRQGPAFNNGNPVIQGMLTSEPALCKVQPEAIAWSWTGSPSTTELLEDSKGLLSFALEQSSVHCAQWGQWENKSNHNRIPHFPHNTIPALPDAVGTTGAWFCLHHEHYVMHAGNFKLHPVFPWQREGLHQRSPGFSLGHPHSGLSCTESLLGTANQWCHQ